MPGIAGARMYHQSGGFIDNQYVGIFMDNVERDRLGLGTGICLDTGMDGDLFSARDLVARPGRRLIDKYLTALDPAADACT